jgi:hypothetical protein
VSSPYPADAIVRTASRLTASISPLASVAPSRRNSLTAIASADRTSHSSAHVFQTQHPFGRSGPHQVVPFGPVEDDAQGLGAGGQFRARRRLALEVMKQVFRDADGRGNVVHGVAPVCRLGSGERTAERRRCRASSRATSRSGPRTPRRC